MPENWTPGPWLFTKPFSENPRIARLQPPPGYGTILTCTESKVDGQWCGMVTEANAHLIAASPDLYAACDLALNSLLAMGVRSGELHDKLRAAMAKARGEKS